MSDLKAVYAAACVSDSSHTALVGFSTTLLYSKKVAACRKNDTFLKLEMYRFFMEPYGRYKNEIMFCLSFGSARILVCGYMKFPVAESKGRAESG